MGFALVRGLVSEGGMFAVGVIVALNVVEDCGAGVAGVLEASALEYCVFAGADE